MPITERMRCVGVIGVFHEHGGAFIITESDPQYGLKAIGYHGMVADIEPQSPLVIAPGFHGINEVFLPIQEDTRLHNHYVTHVLHSQNNYLPWFLRIKLN